jgi:uncharacterized repeat protein (TIGR03803 family)
VTRPLRSNFEFFRSDEFETDRKMSSIEIFQQLSGKGSMMHENRMHITKPSLFTGAALMLIAATLSGPSAWAQNTFKLLHTFTRAQIPGGALARDAAGNLYGTASQGDGQGRGGSGCGVVWMLAPNPNGTWRPTILHAFSGAEGGVPLAGLILDAGGNLYGTAFEGGPSIACNSYFPGCGVVFMLKPNSNGKWTYSVLHGFGLSDGANPEGALTLDAAGNLYGTTALGGDLSSSACGPIGCGVVFKLTPNSNGTWSETVLHSFTGADGSAPTAGLVLDALGNLYGTTLSGGPCSVSCNAGVVFMVAPNSDGSWTENVLHAFVGSADGINPNSTLIFDVAGNLYGTTGYGGINMGGTAFQLSLGAGGMWTENVIHSFMSGPVSADGSNPFAGLTFDAAGNLYGTSAGGSAGFGTVFKLTPSSSGWSESLVHIFGSSAKDPRGPILIDPAGQLYGTTIAGKTNSCQVFKITP